MNPAIASHVSWNRRLSESENPPPDLRALIQSGYRYALSLTHHAEDAEDLVQHACMKAFKAKGSLVGKPYLFAAIRNRFIDSRRRRHESQLSDLHAESIVDGTPNHAAEMEHQSEIERLLSGLSPAQRECLYLNCVEGYTAEEIGNLTGQPRGTVLSHLSRAKRRLKDTRLVSDRVEN